MVNDGKIIALISVSLSLRLPCCVLLEPSSSKGRPAHVMTCTESSPATGENARDRIPSGPDAYGSS